MSSGGKIRVDKVVPIKGIVQGSNKLNAKSNNRLMSSRRLTTLRNLMLLKNDGSILMMD